MICEYCRTLNSETEHRCRRCQRRLGAAVTAYASNSYPVIREATARKYEMVVDREPVAAVAVANRAPAFESFHGERSKEQSLSFPVQGSLFGRDGLKVVTIDGRESTAPATKKRTYAAKRPAGETFDQGVLDFFSAPKMEFRHIGQEVRSAVYCDYRVASVLHRALASVIDGSLILFSIALFAGIFVYGGGEFDFGPMENKLVFGSLLVLLPMIYKLFWAAAAADTPGAQYLGLRLTDFDGRRPKARERVHRVFASALSSLAAGIGLLWVFLDEESLSWQDHISGTFLTADEAHGTNETVATAWAG